MRSPSYLCVCACLYLLSTFEPIGNFYEIQYGDIATEGGLDAIVLML
jgi:hypothetical protein